MRARDIFISLLTASFCLSLGAACDTINNLSGGGFDCATQDGSYTQKLEEDGLLQADIPAQGPFPMAMVLSQDGVNNLLKTVLGQTLPPIKIEESGIDITFAPTIPALQLANVQNCPTCIIGGLGFELSGTVFGESIGRSSGMANLSLPIGMVPQGNSATSVMANMDKASLIDIDLNVAGIDLDDYPFVETLIEGQATSYMQRQLGATELLKLDSWSIGNGDVLLAARTPIISAENKTILIGMHSNLSLPQAATLEEQSQLPEGSELGLQFHPELLLGMVQRLLSEGSIKGDYTEDGAAATNADHHVTMSAMRAPENASSEFLSTEFRVWRTGGGLCGSADIGADLAAQITGESVDFEAQNLRVLEGEGIGEVLSMTQWLGGDFVKSMTDSLELTTNYKDMSVGEDDESAQPIQPKANALTINGQGLSVFLNLGLTPKE